MNNDTTLKIFKGNDRTITVTVKNKAQEAIDITGYTFWFTAKRQETDADVDAVIQKEVITHTNPTAGVTAFDLSNTDTNIEVSSYYYDIQMKDTNDKITTLYKGNLSISERITQAT